MSAFNFTYYRHIFFYITSVLLFAAGFVTRSNSELLLIFLLAIYLVLLSCEYIFCEEKVMIPICVIKLALCVALCMICREWYFFTIFFTIFSADNARLNKLSIFLPTILYLLFCLCGFSKNYGAINYIYCGALLLFGLLVFLSEKLAKMRWQSEKKLREALSRGAVNELNERNLNRELAVKNYLVGQNARLEERERISRSIHNSVGHTITAAIMVLDAAEVLYEVSPNKAKEKTTVAKERMHQGLDAIRSAVRVIDEVEAVELDDFAKKLILICEDFERDSGIKIRHNLAKSFTKIKISQQLAEFLNGALREALSNGVRHGNATAFIVLLSGDSKNLQLTVEDNGKVFSLLEPNEQKKLLEQGFGLKKIKKYCQENGGVLKLFYSDGFKAVIKLPIISCAEENL